jgi:uncharacterized membrane protein YphA (DoxX/SURF4 family)
MNIKLTNNIYNFFFQQQHTYDWITFFRIAVGLLCLLHFIAIIPDFNALFGTTAFIPLDITYAFRNIISYYDILQLTASYGINEQVVSLIYKIIYISSAVFLIIGFFPRINAFILLSLQFILLRNSSYYAYGVDFFTGMSLFYLILTPSDYKLSINRLIWKNNNTQNITPYLRLLQIHLSIGYFFSGFDKILGFNWRNGEAIFKAINLPYANRDFYFDFSFMATYPILSIMAAWFTILIEMCHPVLISIGRTRLVGMYLTISMHLGIALVLNLYFFSAIMIIWNVTAYYFSEQESITLKTVL